MTFSTAANLLESLPIPCFYLTNQRCIAYANALAREQILIYPESHPRFLEGWLLQDTDFTQIQLIKPSDLAAAFDHLDYAVRDGCNGTQLGDTVDLCRPGRHAVRLTTRQKSSGNTRPVHWKWTLTTVTIEADAYFCLTAHDATCSSMDHHQMLRNIARPSLSSTDRSASIRLHDASLVEIDRHDGAASETFAEHTRSVWTEDFTNSVAFSDGIAAEALRNGRSSVTTVQGFQDPGTGVRSIFDATATVLNNPFSDDVLGCLIQVRSAREWSEHIIQHNTMTTLASIDPLKRVRPPMVRTMLLDGTSDYFSPSWVQYSSLCLKDLCTGAWEGYVHPRDLPVLLRQTQIALESGSRQEVEVRYREGDSGGYRYFNDTIAPWQDAAGVTTRWYCLSTDIHNLVAQRTAASLATQRLYNIVNDMDVAIYTVDRDYNFTALEGSINIRSLDGDDRPIDSYTGIKFEDGLLLLHEDDREAYAKGVADVMAGLSTKVAVNYRAGPKHLRSIMVPIKDDSASGECLVKGVLGLAMDFSAQYASEEKEAQLRAMTQASRLKDEFLANISHELRTPIAGILGSMDLLIETELSVSQLDLAHNLQSSAWVLSRIVNDLLDISKVEANAMSFERAAFKMEDVLHDAKRAFQVLALSKNLVLDIEAIDAWPVLIGDALRIRQILHNLLSNAIKFTKSGFVRLTTSQQKVGESTLAVKMVVQDSGIGISEATMTRLFKPFEQADQSTTRNYGGTGLGLSIARKLAHAMGGTIELLSTAGEGTTGIIKLTLDIQSDHAALTGNKMQEIVPSALKPTANLSYLHVLVVEDNEINQKIIVGRLRHLGLDHIACVAHGGEAMTYMVAALRSQDTNYQSKGHEATKDSSTRTPDLIFMDCQMPVLDGFETTRRLRAELQYGGPIIALTASVVQGYREQCLDAGMNEYLTKPFTKDDLQKVLCSWLPGYEDACKVST